MHTHSPRLADSPGLADSPRIVDRLPWRSAVPLSPVHRVVLAVAATAFVAVCAHVSVPIFVTPVPVVLSDFAVLLVGLMLGPATGFAALVLYLAEGAAGLPVFSPQGPGGVAQLLGPTAGYLFAYPLAAAIAGFGGRSLRRVMPIFPAAIVGAAAGTVVILSSGMLWLAHLLHLSLIAAWGLAVLPFLAGSALKILSAAAVRSSFQSRRSS